MTCRCAFSWFWPLPSIRDCEPGQKAEKNGTLIITHRVLIFYTPVFDRHIMVWGRPSVRLTVCPSRHSRPQSVRMLTCCTITQVCFDGSFWNFNTLLELMIVGYLAILTIFFFAIPELCYFIYWKMEYFLTRCTITQVCFHRSFWNFNTLLGLMIVDYLSIVTIFTFAIPELRDFIYWKMGNF